MRMLPLLVLAGALAVTACSRKAPGPDECRDFAYRVAGISHPTQLARPAVRERVDELTRVCLVTPFDRELVRCVEVGYPFRQCTVAFERRKLLD